MVTAFVAGLELPVSTTRLESYRPPAGTDLEMLVNYLWNLELNEALFPTLHAAEISLRNSIHATASSHYGTEFWFDQTDVLLDSQVRSIAKARRKLADDQKPHTAGRIVAALSFGFWVSLLNRPYERQIGNSPVNRLYWHNLNNQPGLLLIAFPHLTKRYRARGPLFARFEQIRDLRNRAAHHEPIWDRPYLKREHDLILNSIGWVSPEMRSAITLCDRFPDVHQNGKALVEAKIKGHLGIT
jgi:hypothetical protein